MTNKHRSALLSTLCLAALPCAAENEVPRFGTVDMQILVEQYHRTIAAQKNLNIERARIQQTSAERIDTISKLDDDLKLMRKQIEDPSLSAKRKQELYQSFQLRAQEGVSLSRDHREYLRRNQTALNEKMMMKMRQLIEEIRKLVADHAREENFSYVFDRSGRSTSQVPILLFAKDASDLTPALLKKLNKDAPAVSKTVKIPDPR